MTGALVLVDEGRLRELIRSAVAAAVAPLIAAASRPSDAAAPDGMVSRAEFAAMLGVDVRTLRRLELEPGALPPPIRIAGRIVRWRRASITRWLDSQDNPTRNAFHSVRGAGSMSRKTGGHSR